MQRCYALFVFVSRIELVAIEELLYRSYFTQPRQLHYILLDRQSRLLIPHILEFDIMFADWVAVGF